MRHQGSIADYISARNKDLQAVFREKLENARQVRISKIVEESVKSPAKRFYVSERRAQDVVTRLIDGESIDDMRPERRRMFLEIYSRVLLQMQSGRAVPLVEIVREVIKQPAPEFYLTPGSALVYLYNIKKSKQ